jgi:hypothetical protein
MTITNGYITKSEALSYVGQSVAASADELEDVVTAVSRQIDNFCGQAFWKTPENTARLFAAEPYGTELRLGAFNTVVASHPIVMSFDVSGDSTYTPISMLSPTAGHVFMPQEWDGPEESPYTSVRLVPGLYFPYNRSNPYNVQIAASWGWAEVPATVKQACRMQVGRIAKRVDSPLGLAGNPEFGMMRVPARLDTDVQAMLTPYIHSDGFPL